MSNPINHYLGNPKLKKANITIDFSKEEIQEAIDEIVMEQF